MTHAFALRFRRGATAPLLVTCSSMVDSQATSEVRRLVAQVMREHPGVEFDGMVYFCNIEKAVVEAV
jgi:hypothetical protein